MTINYHQPFMLLPNRVWRTYAGGKLLDQMEGKPDPHDDHFPEDWIGSATRAVNPGRENFKDEGIGRVRSIDGTIHSMTELVASSPEKILGAAHVKKYGPQPQLLVKLLDSSIRLHIQAHPSAAWAQKNLQAGSGKTEAWWVLGAREPNPYVFFGFQRPPSVREWKRIVETQDHTAMLDCFDRIPVSAGDVLLIEGGVPHAIGPGLFILEIQEPSDYVVRCEYAHGGFTLPESARTMGLGLDRVLDMFDYTLYPKDKVKERFGPRRRMISRSSLGHEEILLEAPQTDWLEVREIITRGALELVRDRRFSILVVLSGSGRIIADTIAANVQPWSRLFLPAVVDSIKVEGNLQVARLLPPQ